MILANAYNEYLQYFACGVAACAMAQEKVSHTRLGHLALAISLTLTSASAFGGLLQSPYAGFGGYFGYGKSPYYNNFGLGGGFFGGYGKWAGDGMHLQAPASPLVVPVAAREQYSRNSTLSQNQ
jgi:hypothetical protein